MMTNSEARKKLQGEAPSEREQVAQQIGTEINEWIIENQDFLLELPVKEAMALVSWNMGLIVGAHARR